MINTAFNGLCMAIADSVPGVSGGTIAFILGFYDRFIDALHHLFSKEKDARKQALLYLLKLGTGWCVGMATCVLLLSGLFEQNIYFMSSVFLGLTLGAIPFIIAAESEVLRGNLQYIAFTLLGAAVVIGISLLRSDAGVIGSIDFLQLRPLHFLYLFFAGMVAITAMVLPGISGSTILLIAGVYLPTIHAVKAFLSLNPAVIPGLLALGLGILCGVGVSIHLIREALKNHRSEMVYLILGLMAGSLYAIVMGPTTLANPIPALSVSSFDIPGFVAGLAILFGLEALRKAMSKKEVSLNMPLKGAADHER